MRCIWYEDRDFRKFLRSLVHFEYNENPDVYLEAIRVTLVAVGYDETYVYGEFSERLEEFFHQYDQED